jgi:hypothetical protein
MALLLVVQFVKLTKSYVMVTNRKYQNYDICKTANIKISGRQNLAKWALACYSGFTHERLLSESGRPYMLAYYLSVFH